MKPFVEMLLSRATSSVLRPYWFGVEGFTDLNLGYQYEPLLVFLPPGSVDHAFFVAEYHPARLATWPPHSSSTGSSTGLPRDVGDGVIVVVSVTLDCSYARLKKRRLMTIEYARRQRVEPVYGSSGVQVFGSIEEAVIAVEATVPPEVRLSMLLSSSD